MNPQFLTIIPVVKLEEKIAGRPWHPVEVARVNDPVVRMALCRGEYHWHSHSGEDELFYVLKGNLTIQMKEPMPISGWARARWPLCRNARSTARKVLMMRTY
ncbi:TPA: hypothetical protein EYP38_00295 [Candidatus Micrarchaeota archaeon]|nr:hypothetical protein [Candidatus Micrarchaeota archaeon]